MPAHATRRSYAAGCRCLPCRAANAAYVAAHRTPAGLVDARPARAYLRQLQAAGVGYRHAAQLARVAPSVVRNVRAGHVTTLQPATLARLLAIRPTLAHGAIIAGPRTHRFLDSLRRDGFTHRTLARKLGHRADQLQLHPRVRVASALKIAQLAASIAS